MAAWNVDVCQTKSVATPRQKWMLPTAKKREKKAINYQLFTIIKLLTINYQLVSSKHFLMN